MYGKCNLFCTEHKVILIMKKLSNDVNKILHSTVYCGTLFDFEHFCFSHVNLGPFYFKVFNCHRILQEFLTNAGLVDL